MAFNFGAAVPVKQESLSIWLVFETERKRGGETQKKNNSSRNWILWKQVLYQFFKQFLQQHFKAFWQGYLCSWDCSKNMKESRVFIF